MRNPNIAPLNRFVRRRWIAGGLRPAVNAKPVASVNKKELILIMLV